MICYPSFQRSKTKQANRQQACAGWLRSMLLLCLGLSLTSLQANEFCQEKGTWVQALGSGGSDLANARAGAGYLIWIDNHARILVDAGAGTALNFVRSKAVFADLEVILLTNMHSDTWADLPVLLRQSYYGHRRTELPVIGPKGNEWLPDTREALKFWWQSKSYQSLPAELLASSPAGPMGVPFRLQLQSVKTVGSQAWNAFRNQRFSVQSMPVDFGQVPSIAWRVKIGSIALTFAGSSSGQNDNLHKLVDKDNLLVVHLGIGEGRRGLLRNIYMSPSAIGHLAAKTGTKALLLGQRMGRTQGLEPQILKAIGAGFKGSILFADDNQCFGF